MAGGGSERDLPYTPTWAVALVCTVIVLVSVAMEHGLHKLGHWFHTRQKKAMCEALEKIKAELMLMGFISLLLAVGQTPISKICIPAKAGSVMLPCKPKKDGDSDSDGDGHRRLLWYPGEEVNHRRFLAAAATDDYCDKKGMVPLISGKGVHELHIFIFVLAVFHVVYSVATMALGRLKMKKWKKWESETTSLEYQFANDPSRFRFTHQTSFVKRHLGLSSTPGVRWIVAFFRQFFGSVTKVDYLTMRQGFINAHLSPNSKFDFHKYIKRSLEDDFKVVVGISLPLWFVAIFILFLDIHGLGTLIWISFVPLVILLLVGTKLEIVIMEMAKEIQDKTTVIKGAPVVEPSNKFFWFNRPEWVLFLIHLTLFQNAFQMAHFVWALLTPGLKECYHENLALSIMKVVVGLALQVLCSYITFPLYALVAQMGSHMKKTIFQEQTAKAVMKWRNTAKERVRQRDAGFDGLVSGDTTPTSPSRGNSPVHLLHKHRGRSEDPWSAPTSPRREQELGDMYPVAEQHGLHRLDPERRRAASSTAVDIDIADSDFSFSVQR
ncbi:MLO protein homolog 1-like [Phragmites australis]|uniref:MLO protein homolog 1-like n=1 Tax=Phragmites australis TaxID=29695 RepID=UPI002D773314|nr:MLO protein homolog 1-like [Phragmites australis]